MIKSLGCDFININSFEELETIGEYLKIDYGSANTLYVGSESYKTKVLNKIAKAISNRVKNDGKQCGPHVSVCYLGKKIYLAINTPNTKEINKLISPEELLDYAGKVLHEDFDNILEGDISIDYLEQIRDSFDNNQVYVITTKEIPSSRDKHLGTFHAEMLISEYLKSSIAPQQTDVTTIAYNKFGELDMVNSIETMRMLKNRILKGIKDGKRVIRFGGTLIDCKLCHAKFHGMDSIKSETLCSGRGSLLHEAGEIVSSIPSDKTFDYIFSKYNNSMILSSTDSGGWHPGWRDGPYSMESKKGRQNIKNKDEERQKNRQELIDSEITDLLNICTECDDSDVSDIIHRVVGLLCSPNQKMSENAYRLIETVILNSDDLEKWFVIIDNIVASPNFVNLAENLPKVPDLLKKAIETILDSDDLGKAIDFIDCIVASPNFVNLAENLPEVPYLLKKTIETILDSDDLEKWFVIIDSIVASPNFVNLAENLPEVPYLITKAIENILDSDDLGKAIDFIDCIVASPNFVNLAENLPEVPYLITKAIENILASSDFKKAIDFIDCIVASPNFVSLAVNLSEVPDLLKKTTETILDSEDLEKCFIIINIIITSPNFENLAVNFPAVPGLIKKAIETGDLEKAIDFIKCIVASPNLERLVESLPAVPDLIIEATGVILESGDLEKFDNFIDCIVTSPIVEIIVYKFPEIQGVINSKIQTLQNKKQVV